MDSTADRILFARQEQLAARQAGNKTLEKTWSEAIDRLIIIYKEEMDRLHANT